MNFNKNIVSGVFWSAIQIIVNRIFSFVIKLFLARILFPEDFGLIGMAAVFISILSVFNELGMSAALVQRSKEDLSSEHYHTAFWTGVIWSIIIFSLVVFVVSPLAADFYSEPMLRKIIPFLSLGILISPINLVHKAKLTRSLNFKKLAIIENTSSFFAGVLSLSLAFLGAGVWALVFNSVTVFVIAMPQYFTATRWFPKVLWSKKAFKDIFGFGAYTTGTQLLGTVINQFDFLLVGKLMGASALGIYSFAFMITSVLKSQIIKILTKVMYPIYSKMNGEKDIMKKYYLKVLRINIFLVYPIMFFILLFAKHLIPLFFGDKWLGAVPIINVLSASVIISMIINSSNPLIRAYGKPGLELKIQVIKAFLFFLPFISLGTIYYGVIGTAIGYTVAVTFSVFLSMYYMNKLIGLRMGEIFKEIQKPAIASISTFTITFLYLEVTARDLWYTGIIVFILSLATIVFFFAEKEVLLMKNLFKQYAQKKY